MAGRPGAADPLLPPVPGDAAARGGGASAARGRRCGGRRGRARPPPHPARPRPARLLPRGRRRAGHGRLRAPQSEPAFLPQGTGRVEAIPPDFNGRLLEEDWERFEEIAENSKRRVPAMDEITVTKLINGPEAFTPDNEFCLGESEVAGFFVCAGFCAHGLAGRGRDRQSDGGVDRRGRTEPRPLAHGRAPLRRRSTARPPTPTPGSGRPTRPTTTSATPTTSAGAGRPLRLSPVNGWHREHGAAFGEKSGWERVNWYESERRRGRRGAAPARLGGQALVAGDRRRAPRRPRGGRDLRRDLLRQARDRGAGRGRLPRRALRQPGRPRGRPDHLHADAQPPRRDRVRLHGRAAWRGALRDRHRHRLRQPRPRVDAAPPPGGRRRPDRRRHLAVGLLRDLGPRGARRAGAADPGRPLQRGLPLHVAARDRRSATCRCGRCG